jgi:Tfp pilus assembly protein PilZ
MEKKSNEISVTDRLHDLIRMMSEDDQRNLLEELEQRVLKGKREHYRKPFFTTVDYSNQDGVYKDFIKDISYGGVFIETSTPFSIGQEISLTFPIPNQQTHIKITGEIVRVSNQGIGIKFKIADEGQGTIIKALLDMI